MIINESNSIQYYNCQSELRGQSAFLNNTR